VLLVAVDLIFKIALEPEGEQGLKSWGVDIYPAQIPLVFEES
jgi:hypothetical protein